jgi:hypothetical protein
MDRNDERLCVPRIPIKKHGMGAVQPDSVILVAVKLDVFERFSPVPQDPVQ